MPESGQSHTHDEPGPTQVAQPTDAGAAVVDIIAPEYGAIYRPSEDRERTRSLLALGALSLLALTICLVAVPIVAGIRTWSELEGMCASLLPALLTVVGSALGFYFGTEKD